MNRRAFLQTAATISVGSTARASKLVFQAFLPFPLTGPVPTFENGVVSILDSALTTVSLVDLKGDLLGSFSPRMPRVAVERISHVAISPAKRIVISFSGRDSTGRLSFFLAFADISGRISHSVQMHAFAPRRVIFLPGDRLLSLGREYDSDWEEIPRHNVLRFLSPEGTLQKSTLEVTGLRSATSGHPLHWTMVAAPGRIGLLDAEDRRYCEIDYDGAIVRPLGPLGITAPDHVTGMALLPNGDRLVTLDRPRMEGGRLHYGHICAVLQISGPPGRSMSSTSRPDMTPRVEKSFVTALGSYDGRVVLLARPSDRLLIFEG